MNPTHTQFVNPKPKSGRIPPTSLCQDRRTNGDLTILHTLNTVQFSSVLQDVHKAQSTSAGDSAERTERVQQLKAQINPHAVV